MMETGEILMELTELARRRPEIRKALLQTADSDRPLSELCRISTELGYPLYEMDLISAEPARTTTRPCGAAPTAAVRIHPCWKARMIIMSFFFPTCGRSESEEESKRAGNKKEDGREPCVCLRCLLF